MYELTYNGFADNGYFWFQIIDPQGNKIDCYHTSKTEGNRRFKKAVERLNTTSRPFMPNAKNSDEFKECEDVDKC